MMMEAKIGENVIAQLARETTLPDPAQLNIQFLPNAPADISWTGGELDIQDEMDKLNFDWRMEQMEFTFVPGDIEFTVTQRPDVIVKYVGGPCMFRRPQIPTTNPLM